MKQESALSGAEAPISTAWASRAYAKATPSHAYSSGKGTNQTRFEPRAPARGSDQSGCGRATGNPCSCPCATRSARATRASGRPPGRRGRKVAPPSRSGAGRGQGLRDREATLLLHTTGKRDHGSCIAPALLDKKTRRSRRRPSRGEERSPDASIGTVAPQSGLQICMKTAGLLPPGSSNKGSRPGDARMICRCK